MAMKMLMVVFWLIISFKVVGKFQCFRETLKVEEVCFFGILVSVYKSAGNYYPEVRHLHT